MGNYVLGAAYEDFANSVDEVEFQCALQMTLLLLCSKKITSLERKSKYLNTQTQSTLGPVKSWSGISYCTVQNLECSLLSVIPQILLE